MAISDLIIDTGLLSGEVGSDLWCKCIAGAMTKTSILYPLNRRGLKNLTFQKKVYALKTKEPMAEEISFRNKGNKTVRFCYVEKVLFVCVENAGRSQMAEGFLRRLAPRLEVLSAGTQPKSTLNPNVVKVMREIGIDIAKQKPKELTTEMISQSITVDMGCVDEKSCPALFVKDVLDCNISDPKDKDLDQIREIRNQIKNKVENLIKTLENKS